VLFSGNRRNHYLALAFESCVCHDPDMANEEAKDKLEGRFAEAIRKSKEKRASMQRATERPANLEDESRNNEDTSVAGRAFESIKDSET